MCFGVRVSFLKLLGNEIVDLDPFSPLPTGKNWARILRIVLPRTWISALFSLSLSLLSLFRLSFCVDLGFGLPDCLKRTSSLMTVPSLKGCGDRRSDSTTIHAWQSYADGGEVWVRSAVVRGRFFAVGSCVSHLLLVTSTTRTGRQKLHEAEIWLISRCYFMVVFMVPVSMVSFLNVQVLSFLYL